jgi:hypothetical protein
MGTYHWLQGDESVVGALPIGFPPDIDLVVPAGSILKKFLVRNTSLMAVQTGAGYNTVGPIQINMLVEWIPLGVAARKIYQSSRQVPQVVTSLYDVIDAARIYSMYYNGGDNEFSVDQECSYGKKTDAFDSTVKFRWSLFGGVGGLTFAPAGIMSYEFAALYYTPT